MCVTVDCSVGEKDAAIEELRQKLVIVNEDISSSVSRMFRAARHTMSADLYFTSVSSFILLSFFAA